MMPYFKFDSFLELFSPVGCLFAWIPVAGFIVGAVRAWRRDRKVFRKTYLLRNRWVLATPLIVILELVGIAAHCHVRYERLPNGFWYLFWSLVPLMLYLEWRYRECRSFIQWLLLAQVWLALWVCALAVTGCMRPFS